MKGRRRNKTNNNNNNKEEKTRKMKLASPCGTVMIQHTDTKIPHNENEKGKDKQQHSKLNRIHRMTEKGWGREDISQNDQTVQLQ